MHLIGHTFAGYRIVSKIGMGGMATTYRAYDARADLHVALQVMRREFFPTPQSRSAFLNKFAFMDRLNHPNIPTTGQRGEENGMLYSVVPFFEGARSLLDLIRNGHLSFAEAARITLQIASALDHAHAHGIVHCDVCPHNIIIDKSQTVLLMDWGRAETLDARDEPLLGQLRKGYCYNEYAPYESVLSEKPDSGFDIYALAVILYEMVTGKHPFPAHELIVRFMKQVNDPLPMPRDYRPDLSERAQFVLLKALDRDPNARYKSAGHLAAAFCEATQVAATFEAQANLNADQLGLRVRPVRIFISFAEADLDTKEELVKHLAVGTRAGDVELRSADQIPPGSDWQKEVEDMIRRADAALLLISADFLADTIIQDVHVPALLARYGAGSLPVIPVLLRASQWLRHPWIGKLKPLPEHGKPIAMQHGHAREDALVNITSAIWSEITRHEPKRGEG